MKNTCFQLIIGILVFWATNGWACSCMWGGTFDQMAQKSALVVEGRVVKYGRKLSHGEDLHENMTVEIIAVHKGEYKKKTLQILGDPGHLCRPYVSRGGFPIGEHFLFALSESDQDPQALSVCGEYFIRKKGDTLEGMKMEATGFVPYQMEAAALSF